MATSIKLFFDDNQLPLLKEMPTEYEEVSELSKMYFMLTGVNKSIVANFKQGNENSPMLLAHWYSRHRFCPVWNMRKSQLIRKKYREFLTTHTVISPITGKENLLIREYTPIHMVLTMPHKEGWYKGKRFYARELLKAFMEMRRCDFFKDYIHGGEYGLEIKKSKQGNGLHIHLHSLCFLSPLMKVNDFRAWLREKWEQLTGSKFCHFETLYFYKKNERGGYILDPNGIIKKKNKEGFYEAETETFVNEYGELKIRAKLPRKKFYINKDSPIDEYMHGVMECIKYHFKNDTMKDENGDWDVPLMNDVLNHSKRLRFYSRYGSFYKQQALNFNNLPATEKADENDSEGEEEKIMGEAEQVEITLLNPFTNELAARTDYDVCIVRTEKIKFKKQPLTGEFKTFYDDDLQKYMSRNKAHPSFTLSEIIQAVCRNESHRVIVGDLVGAV